MTAHGGVRMKVLEWGKLAAVIEYTGGVSGWLHVKVLEGPGSGRQL